MDRLEVEYHSFELSPDTPVDFDGTEVDFLVGHKRMPAAQVESMLAQMTQLASTEGLSYDFDALQHTNTVKAHELLHYAKAQGRQLDMKERLLSAYFEEGRHVGRIDDLADLAEEIGLDRAEVVEALKSERFLARRAGRQGPGDRVRDQRCAVLRHRRQVRRLRRAGSVGVRRRAAEGGVGRMNPLEMVGADTAPVCEDGVCEIPGAVSEPTRPRSIRQRRPA